MGRHAHRDRLTAGRSAIEAIEGGLLTAIQIQGRPEGGMSLAERMAHYRVPGTSIALVAGGELAWNRGYGVVEAGDGEAVTPEAIFQAASISKPVAAMVTLALVETGALDLDGVHLFLQESPTGLCYRLYPESDTEFAFFLLLFSDS
jgi:CubicO group peptidase (beta-lactamase class C family)